MNIPIPTSNNPTWIQVGTLIDGYSDEALTDAHLVYTTEEYLYVGTDIPAAEIVGNKTSPDVILNNYTLLPGLIDCHTHLFLEGGELDFEKRKAYLSQSPEALLEQAKLRLDKLVGLGIQAVRDAGDKDGVGLALAKLYRSENRPLMPYIDSPGAAIHREGRYGKFMGYAIENNESLLDCIESRIENGSDRIKLIPTGIINFKKGLVTAKPQMTAEEVAEFVEAAKLHGKQTFAHASGDLGIDVAIKGGVDTVEHAFFIRDDQLETMKEKNIAWVPTFAPVQKQVDHADVMGWPDEIVANLQKILDQHAISLRKANTLGVTILAGSDAGSCAVAHGLGFLYELMQMEEAGLPSMQVIQSATGTPSQRLAFSEKIGQIKPGYKSRFLLTEHSPLETVANLQKEKNVIFDGRQIDTSIKIVGL